MALPPGLSTVTVTGTYLHPGGAPLKGSLVFRPEPAILTSASLGTIVLGTLDSNGAVTATLLATDDSDVTPTGWTYRVTERWDDASGRTYALSLPAAAPTVDLADVAPTAPSSGEYVVVTGPRGNAVLSGVGTPSSSLGTNGDYYVDTAAYPVSATMYGPKASGAWPLNGIPIGGGDGSGPPGKSAYELAVLNGFSGTITEWLASLVGPVGATGATGATGPQGPKGDTGATGPAGGGGSSIRTATVRVTNDNLSGLPAAGSWAIVQTSAGTKLQASIAATSGDRIRLSGASMRVGSHFLDWAMLSDTGAIAVYAGSGSSSPLTQGHPAMYPSLSFSYVTGDEMFTVSAGHIDGSGLVTIALVHQGSSSDSSSKVYAYPDYPWRVRLENIGPEPA
ncbi:hypothetical protein SAMN05216532_4004 [Streptomyces sp. 2231.1]|uniref:hypothetical protein n=1 Tax=Streptomyces sp. 2231.1 TaxID=1855347 RepID=UPI0008957609|nr:hypothetical protein [Streptomyces sp. 2231.1]SED26716.1 hypothetical protein SAMN05216532_4004 [Streptomyces sp. 2231.1]